MDGSEINQPIKEWKYSVPNLQERWTCLGDLRRCRPRRPLGCARLAAGPSLRWPGRLCTPAPAAASLPQPSAESPGHRIFLAWPASPADLPLAGLPSPPVAALMAASDKVTFFF